MPRVLIVLLLSLAATPWAQTRGGEVVVVSPFELHNSFWMSLHQTLIADVTAKSPRALTALSAEERTAWDASVAEYRSAAGQGDLIFARPVMITSDAISQVADDAVEPTFDAPLGGALLRAAPTYRRHWWPADEKANRFAVAYAAAMLRDIAPDLVQAHGRVYGVPWPSLVRVYFSPYGGPFGAYTIVGRAGGPITAVSSRDQDYQGFRVVEMLFHEGSHAVVGPNNGPVATAIAAAAQKHGVRPPGDFWHALLFATSSELARLALAERGVAGFVPSSDDLFTRVWPRQRAAVEMHWLPYVRGAGTLADAIDKTIAALPR